MGNNLFGANISGQIASAFGSSLLPVKLIKRASQVLGKAPTAPATYNCRGMVEEYKVTLANNSRVKQGDKKVTILGDTIAGGKVAPEPNDEIQVFFGGKLLKLLIQKDGVGSDPDAATYSCHCRG